VRSPHIWSAAASGARGEQIPGIFSTDLA